MCDDLFPRFDLFHVPGQCFQRALTPERLRITYLQSSQVQSICPTSSLPRGKVEARWATCPRSGSTVRHLSLPG